MRKVSFFFLFFLSIISFSFSSFAGVASGSNAMRVPRASWSNASKAWDDFKDSFDRINDVQSNTASLYNSSSSYTFTCYARVSNDVKYAVEVSSSGGVIEFPKLSGDDYYREITIDIPDDGLPSYGKYNFAFNLMDIVQSVRASGVDNVESDYFVIADSQKNVMPSYSDGYSITVDKSSNLWSASGVVALSGKTSLVGYHMVLYRSAKVQNIKFNLRNISISYAGASQEPIVSAPSVNNQNSLGAVSDAANALVDKQDSIIDQIVNTTQTISNQLYSFWNQLAGEFTNLYNKLNLHHQEDLDKLDEQISADRQNTDDIINNQDKNTDQITDGFDSSGMNSANDKLKGQLSDYDSKEKEVLNQVNEKVDSFEFEEPLSASHFVGPLEDIRYFLTGVYNGYSSLNIPIGFSLTLTIALIVIGYYRFKGGS